MANGRMGLDTRGRRVQEGGGRGVFHRARRVRGALRVSCGRVSRVSCACARVPLPPLPSRYRVGTPHNFSQVFLKEWMMSAKRDFVSNPGNGAAWRNMNKTNDKQPDWRGDITLLDGTQVNIAAWEKHGRTGVFLSFALTEKVDKGNGAGAPSWGAVQKGQGYPAQAERPASRATGGFVADSDIPF